MKSSVIIIAEAGVNHNGSIEIAKQMIDVAVEAGADYIKFQTFKASNLVAKIAKKAAYQNKNIGNDTGSQYEMLKNLELTESMHEELIGYSKFKGIPFLSSGFDEVSIDCLDMLGTNLFKIPSGEITNKPYLLHVAKKGKPVIISTGMANLGEIEAALHVIMSAGLTKDMITLLHCNTEYPTPMEDVNLKAMLTIKESFKLKVGYSDHTKGVEVAIAAVALGAEVIEKHFTLDKKMPGPDHLASLEPQELKAMVTAIRNIELAISGTGLKEASPSEMPNKNVARKSIHLLSEMKIGDTIKQEHLIMKRPGDGISPMLIDLILGRTIIHDLPIEHKLDWKDLG